MLIGILIALGLSFLFSGVEIAFLSSNKLHIELQRKQGFFFARLLSVFLRNPGQFLSSILIGNTLSLVLYSYYMSSVLDPWLGAHLFGGWAHPGVILVLQTLITTCVVLFIAEYFPKNIFFIKPNFFLSALALPLWGLYYLMYPFVWVVISFAKYLIRGVGLRYQEPPIAFGLGDLKDYMKGLEHAGASNDDTFHTYVFNNALYFKDIQVRDCMVTRTELVAVNINEGVSGIRRAAQSHDVSRILLYKDSIDNIVGYYHVLSLISNLKSDASIENYIISAPITTETRLVNELLVELLKKRKNLALVVDEYGGTAGIITLEDIVENIFGEIEDEYDREFLVAKRLGHNTYLFSARLEVQALNEQYSLSLPEGDYDTLGGLFLSFHEKMPKKGAVVHVGGSYRLKVISKQKNRIDMIRMEVKK